MCIYLVFRTVVFGRAVFYDPHPQVHFWSAANASASIVTQEILAIQSLNRVNNPVGLSLDIHNYFATQLDIL